MPNFLTVAARMLVFPVAFAAILGSVQLRVEAAERAPQIVSSATNAMASVNGWVSQRVASWSAPKPAEITLASR